jgi:hypothetical protein
VAVERCSELYGESRCDYSAHHLAKHKTFVGLQLVRWRTASEVDALRAAAAEASEIPETSVWG